MSERRQWRDTVFRKLTVTFKHLKRDGIPPGAIIAFMQMYAAALAKEIGSTEEDQWSTFAGSTGGSRTDGVRLHIQGWAAAGLTTRDRATKLARPSSVWGNTLRRAPWEPAQQR